MSFVHLAQSANIVEQVIAKLERHEPVHGMRDAYCDGPLGDVDEGAKCRVEWWTRLHDEPLDDEDARRLDDRDLWERVRSEPNDFVLWHGPHPAERIFALRACWHLRDEAHRIYEVALQPSGRWWTSTKPRAAFFDAVGIQGQKAMAGWDHRRKVEDVLARAHRWEELRARRGDWIRLLDDDEQIVHHSMAFYDPMLT